MAAASVLAAPQICNSTLPLGGCRGSIHLLMLVNPSAPLTSTRVLVLALLCTALTLSASSGTASEDDAEARAVDSEATPPPLPSLAAAEERGTRPLEDSPDIVHQLIVLDGASIMTATGKSFDSGHIVIDGGRIKALGEGPAPALEGAHHIDASGMFITPGIIDTHSHLGVYAAPSSKAHGDGNEATSPTTPGVWAEHSFGPQDPGIQRAVAGGVTTIQVLPGSANLIGGRGVVLQMVPHRGSRAMRFPGAPETLKMACGENPKRVYGSRSSAPSTRMGNLRATRMAFIKAQRALAKLEEHEAKAAAATDGGKKKRKRRKDRDDEAESKLGPERDLDTESLMGVLRGEILPQVHCYRADDMLSMLQLADEFGFRIRSFHHATDAYKIRDILAERQVAASTWADWWGFKLEAYDAIPESAALLSEAGGLPVIHSDSSVGIQRLNQEAAKAWYAGLHAGIDVPREEALSWITLNPAWVLGIDHDTGSLEVGKRADLVVWDGDPFSVYSSARWVFIEGVLRHDSSNTTRWSDFELGQGGER
jgi:imidazolonepropionase-like amidohydrolase